MSEKSYAKKFASFGNLDLIILRRKQKLRNRVVTTQTSFASLSDSLNYDESVFFFFFRSCVRHERVCLIEMINCCDASEND